MDAGAKIFGQSFAAFPAHQQGTDREAQQPTQTSAHTGHQQLGRWLKPDNTGCSDYLQLKSFLKCLCTNKDAGKYMPLASFFSFFLKKCI